MPQQSGIAGEEGAMTTGQAAEDLFKAGTNVILANNRGRLLTGVVQSYKDAAAVVLASDGRTWKVPVRLLAVDPAVGDGGGA